MARMVAAATASSTALRWLSCSTAILLLAAIATSTAFAFTFSSMRVINTFPHDPAAFTEGLCGDARSIAATGGNLDATTVFESTGIWGRSELRHVNLTTGIVIDRVPLSRDFGEGCAVIGDRIYQLTYKERNMRVFNVSQTDTWASEADAIEVGVMPSVVREGWGLASSPTLSLTEQSTAAQPVLVASDGTAALHFLDPSSLTAISSIVAHFPATIPFEPAQILNGLNELEVIGDIALANVIGTPCIAQIDLRTGQVVGAIVKPATIPAVNHSSVRVMNGILYLPHSQSLLVTGKLWPRMYQVTLFSDDSLNALLKVMSPAAAFRRTCPKAAYSDADALFEQQLLFWGSTPHQSM